MKKNKNIVIWANHNQPPPDSERHWRQPLENVLLSLGYEKSRPPLADLLKYYHALKGEWFIISPVYFHTTHNDSMISQCGPQLNLTPEEGKWYFDKVSDFLQADNMVLHYHSPTLWLGQMSEPTAIHSHSPAYLHNKSIMPYLRSLGDDLSWQKLLTESQMYLQSLHLNNQTNQNVNGLWFWGQGKLTVQHDRIVTDDAAMLGLKALWPELVVQSPLEISQLQKAKHIVLSNFSEGSLEQINQICQPYPCHWYWNNITYQQSAKRWWQLFRRK